MYINQRQPALSTRETVYRQLREQIITMELAPGTPLSENETSALFQVSRTPVRESFMRLAQDGLVQVLPQRGTFVSLIDTGLVEEARFMREQLEGAVIELACSGFDKQALLQLEINLKNQQDAIGQADDKQMFELDEQFHMILFAGCNKANTWHAMQQLTVHLNRSRRLMLASDRNWKHLYEQHTLMFDAIVKQDAQAGKNIMEQHINLSVNDQQLLKQKFPNYFQ